MPYILDQQINTGSFVPTTNVWDVSSLYEVEVTSPEFKELLVRLYQTTNNIAVALNTKVTGYYINEEFVSGKLFYNPNSNNPLELRPGFIKTVDTGVLAPGVNTIAHNLAVTNTWQWMSISGAATDSATVVGYPLPFSGIAANIEVTVDATNININNGTAIAFTSSQITLEYVKY